MRKAMLVVTVATMSWGAGALALAPRGCRYASRAQIDRALSSVPKGLAVNHRALGRVRAMITQSCKPHGAHVADTTSDPLEIYAQYAQATGNGTVSTAVMDALTSSAATFRAVDDFNGLSRDGGGSWGPQSWSDGLDLTCILGCPAAADRPKARVANGPIYCYSGDRYDRGLSHDGRTLASVSKQVGQYCADGTTILTVKNLGHGHYLNTREFPSFCTGNYRVVHGSLGSWINDDGAYHSTWMHGAIAMTMGVAYADVDDGSSNCFQWLPGSTVISVEIRNSAQVNPPHHDCYPTYGFQGSDCKDAKFTVNGGPR